MIGKEHIELMLITASRHISIQETKTKYEQVINKYRLLPTLKMETNGQIREMVNKEIIEQSTVD